MTNFRKKLPLLWFLLALSILIWVGFGAIVAEGSEDECRYNCEQDDDNGNVDANADANASASASAVGEGGAGGKGGSAFAEGGAGGEGGTGGTGVGGDAAGGDATGGSASIVYGKRAPTNFLYMQNQVEACGRTFGFSGSNTSGGWAFGIPIPRSWTPTCDLWKAAEEAQQNGFVFTSYMFQCSIKAVWDVLGNDTCKKFELMSLVEMGMIEEPPDLTDIYDRAAQYDERWLMADITQEDYEAQQEMIEERLEQQQVLLDQRAELIEEYDKELEELKNEQETHKQAETEKKNAFNALYEKLVQEDET